MSSFSRLEGLPRDYEISYIGSRYSDDQPRDDHGRWTDDGGGDDGGSKDQGSGKGTAGSAGQGRETDSGHHGAPSGPYEGGNGRTSNGGRVLLGADIARTYTPSETFSQDLKDRGATPVTYHELRAEHGAAAFHKAIDQAKAANPYGAAVNLYPEEDYQHMRLFLSEDGKTGFALKGDDIVSVFKHPDATQKRIVSSILPLAVQQGGRRLDCFDTELPHLYGKQGFEAVSRTPFNTEFQPDGWKQSDYAKFNGGKPDVVFMSYKGGEKAYQAGDGKTFASYDEAAAAQVKATPGTQRSASDLFAQHNDPHAQADKIVDSVPGARLAIARAEQRMAQSVPTNDPVSAGGFKQPDGTYTPDRQALHQKILSGIFNKDAVRAATPAKGEKPNLALLGGRGGSGKSWFTQTGHVDVTKAIYLNPDDIKGKLPGFQGWNAPLYHEEASEISDMAEATARKLGVNVVFDATMRAPGSSLKRFEDYSAQGYNVTGHYMFVPPQESTKRALTRFMRGGETGRFVPPSYTLSSTTNEQTFDSLRDKFSDWELYDNSGKSPQFVARKSDAH